MRGLAAILTLGIFLSTASSATANNTCPQGLPEDPEIDVLIPHEYDCTKFYKCSHGEKVEQNCPVGLHFNAEANHCDWPAIAQCENSTNTGNGNETNTCPNLPEDPEEDILFPHESDCSKFYKCSHGEKILQDCPEGLHFNSKTNQCDWPQNAQCQKDPNSGNGNNTGEAPNTECPLGDPLVDILMPHESDCTKFYQCDNGQKVLRHCPAGLHFNPKIDRCDWPANANCENSNPSKNNTNECPVDDPLANILIPHESDCSKFYQCSNGEKILHNCSVGLHFNPSTQQCDWPENVKCENNNSGANTGGNTTTPENECPLEDPAEDILFPHEHNCAQFYKCSHGEKVLQNCPAGLHFNPSTNQCDWPENFKCENNNNNGVNTGGNTTTPKNKCPLEDPEEDILFPHEQNCAQFYKCSHGEKVLQDCPAGLHFNSKTGQCDWPENANCEHYNSNKNNTNECPTNDPLANVFLPHEFDCSKFYQCSNGEKILHNCSVGLHFNPNTNQCDWPENVQCENNNSSTINPGENIEIQGNDCPLEDPAEDILFPHENNCAQFYKCSHGEKVIQDCPLGLHFNSKTGQCDWPENANCEADSNIDGNNNDNGFDKEPSECPSEDLSEDILFPHESNCSQFYKCSHGEKVLQNCPAGLHFNPVLKHCDWPENTNCSSIRYIPHEKDCTRFYQLLNNKRLEYICVNGLQFNPALQICDYKLNVRCQPTQ